MQGFVPTRKGRVDKLRGIDSHVHVPSRRLEVEQSVLVLLVRPRLLDPRVRVLHGFRLGGGRGKWLCGRHAGGVGGRVESGRRRRCWCAVSEELVRCGARRSGSRGNALKNEEGKSG
jgi:hypothetical protein